MINWADQSSCIPVSYTYWLHITAGDFYQVATIDVIALHWILLCIPLRNVFLNAFITSISHLWCFSITCSKMLGFLKTHLIFYFTRLYFCSETFRKWTLVSNKTTKRCTYNSRMVRFLSPFNFGTSLILLWLIFLYREKQKISEQVCMNVYRYTTKDNFVWPENFSLSRN